MLHFDTETCGLVGPVILIQYAQDDDSPIIHNVWKEPVYKTLELIERLCDDTVCAFNLSFDWFHITQLYNTYSCVRNKKVPPKPDEIARIFKSRPSDYCPKPKGCLDLFLHARKGPWQVLMGRRPITIRKVPVQIAENLSQELKRRIHFEDIFFRRRRDGYEWKLKDPENGFVNLSLVFAPSSGLKSLIEHLFKISVDEINIPKEWQPQEDAFNPYGTNWLDVLDYHLKYWEKDRSLTYAYDDVLYLQRLYHHFGDPEPNDIDSQLAVCVGACRWRGYKIDLDGIIERIELKHKEANSAPTAPREALKYIHEVCTPTERLIITSTSKDKLEKLVDRYPRVQEILNARKAEKELDILWKLLNAGRFCPDFKVIGAKSGRMSGGSDEGITGGSINPQGINRQTDFRRLFQFNEHGDVTSGGDFGSFEVSIIHAWCEDPQLTEEIKSGLKLQGVLGTEFYDIEYDELLKDLDRYTFSKNSLYAMFYGAEEDKLSVTAHVSLEKAREALKNFLDNHPKYKEERQKIIEAFRSMIQPNGIGTEIIWRDPAPYVRTLLGFPRYFTLENKVVKALFDLAQNPPKSLHSIGRVIRRDREQSVVGATQSALYACAFQIQAQNMRAAGNHIIQGTGAGICKEMQVKIWDLQPSGINEWHVQPMNMHDEIVCVHKPILTYIIKDIVNKVLEDFRKIIPFINMNWKTEINNWGDLK